MTGNFGPVPPFTRETAELKVSKAQVMWNTKDPNRVKLGYSTDCIWRNRDHFLQGHDHIVEFLTKKWDVEQKYRLKKQLFAFTDNKIAVQFWYEFHDAEGQWWRCYGLEDWTFAPSGQMSERMMSGNNVKIAEAERWFTDEVVDLDNFDINAKLKEHWQ